MSDRLPCPHCGKMFTDLWDYNWDGKEEIYTKCESCDKSVDIIRRVSVSYELRIPPPYEDDETLHERDG
jgi:uncharacterized C2H2 Zn-finger protein